MIRKSTFKNLLEDLKILNNKEENYSLESNPYIQYIIDNLSSEMFDTKELIKEYIRLDFGENWEKEDYIDSDGYIVDISNPDVLYDELIKNKDKMFDKKKNINGEINEE